MGQISAQMDKLRIGCYFLGPRDTLLVCAEVFEVAKKLCTFLLLGEAKYGYLLAGVAYWEIL